MQIKKTVRNWTAFLWEKFSLVVLFCKVFCGGNIKFIARRANIFGGGKYFIERSGGLGGLPCRIDFMQIKKPSEIGRLFLWLNFLSP